MTSIDSRTDPQTRGIVEEGVCLFHSRGPTAAANFLYRFGVAAAVIERVLAREKALIAAPARAGKKVGPILISDVLATQQLAVRQPCLPQREGLISKWPLQGPTLNSLLESAQSSIGADSVGISVFDERLDDLTWIEIVGELAPHKGNKIPRRNSMCDVCFQTAESHLFIEPHCFYTWMETAGMLAKEALVTPIHGYRQFHFGTLWAVANIHSSIEFTAAHLGMLKLHAAAVRETLESKI